MRKLFLNFLGFLHVLLNDFRNLLMRANSVDKLQQRICRHVLGQIQRVQNGSAACGAVGSAGQSPLVKIRLGDDRMCQHNIEKNQF